jgi:hypothetical protein
MLPPYELEKPLMLTRIEALTLYSVIDRRIHEERAAQVDLQDGQDKRASLIRCKQLQTISTKIFLQFLDGSALADLRF